MTTTIQPEAEPTLFDVIQIMQAGFARVGERFDALNAKFEEELREVKQRLFKVELRLEDVADAVHGHDKRIIMLESWKKNMGKSGLAGA